ncbi:uncharacterized protein [Aegilops tauschii subsp. strangulata]|uniref:uncharacterized protein n=1 Tax=Aegilops tauschii subsp. strangulata TaxID=200361 RepID=UPI003CC841FB
MVGLFKTARDGMAHLLVAMDKFTKWMEAKLIKKLNGPNAVTFITDITIRFTPFFLVYGAEDVIPTDIKFDLPRVTIYTEAEAKEAREDGVDLLEEAWLLALSRFAIYQQSLRRYHSRKVRP